MSLNYNFEIGQDPTSKAIVLNSPKGPRFYNGPTKLDRYSLIGICSLTIIYIEPLGQKKNFSGLIFGRLLCTKIVLIKVLGFLFILSLS